MVNEVKVDLTIRDNSTGDYLRIPVLPATIAFTEGEKLADSKHIINIGDVEFLNGTALSTMEWSSFFPARYDPGYCAHSELKTPVEYKAMFNAWKDAGTHLQLICPAAGLSVVTYLQNFTWELRGFEGDIYYNVGFKQLRKLLPRQIEVQVDAATQTISAVDKLTPESRTEVPAKATPKTYTVKSGDSLSLIAKRLGIPNWRTIYDANKSVIGANPNKIYPGQVLTI